MLRLSVASLLVFAFANNLLAASSLKLPVTKDNSIVLLDNEWTENAGGQGRIRIKGNQHIVAMSFDLSQVAGKRITKAQLVCHQGEQTISAVTISTIATAWDEMKSNSLQSGIEGSDHWGYEGAMFPAVIGGNSFTLTTQTASELVDGKYHWSIPPDMIHAMAVGIAHGLAIHEHDADYGRNPTIFAREQSSKQPYLLVEYDEQTDAMPLPAQSLEWSIHDDGSARLSMVPPATGFAYEIFVGGVRLGQHNIPLVSTDPRQTVSIRDLPASMDRNPLYEVSVVTLNRTGQRSEAAKIRGQLSQVRPLEFPNTTATLAAPNRSTLRSVSIIPVTDKYDSTGKPVGDLPGDYRTNNSLFNGERVQLRAAAGEVVSFQMLLPKSFTGTPKITLDDAAVRIDLLRGVYVESNGRKIPDPLLPLNDKRAMSSEGEHVFVADLYIPFETSAMTIEGKIELTARTSIPIEVEVLPFSLPKRATFFCEMNSYGLPDKVEDYYALQNVAYEHRVHANILHYSHHTAAPGSRKSNLDMRLPSGRRMDNKRYDNIAPMATSAHWDDFVEAFEPYINGSLFRDGHRGPIPAPGFYLTFHESWPLNCREYFSGDPDAFKAFAQSPAYSQTYVNILQDFAQLAKSKGWTETGFQVYFNNKGSLDEQTKSPWILDEPSSYWDFRALTYYGELTDRGRKAAPEVTIDYRIDISRPEFCRGELSQRGDLWVVSSWAFEHYRRLVTDRMQRDGLKVWVYGTSNPIDDTNRNLQAWALDAWAAGATGIVPWQTVDQSGDALTRADQLGIFIFDKDSSGDAVVRHSIRLKAYRDAQQLIEYLNLVKAKQKWSHDEMNRFVSHYVNLKAEVNKTNEDDAGTSAYAKLSPAGLERLRLAAAKLLSED